MTEVEGEEQRLEVGVTDERKVLDLEGNLPGGGKTHADLVGCGCNGLVVLCG